MRPFGDKLIVWLNVKRNSDALLRVELASKG